MKISLNKIADLLKELHPVFIHEIPVEDSVRSIFLLHRDTVCNSAYAYLLETGSLYRLKKCSQDRKLSFIIFGKDIPVADRFSERWNVLFLHTDAPRSIVYEKVQQAAAVYTDWYDRLTETILARKPLQEQLDRAAEMLQNPIALYDISYSLLAWAGQMPDNGKAKDLIWSHAITHGYALRKNIPAAYLRELERERQARDPVVVPDFSVPCENRIIKASLFYQEMIVGCLAMDEICVPFTRGEVSVVYQIQKLLEYSQPLIEKLSLDENGSNGIFKRLIAGETISSDLLDYFLTQQGCREGEAYQIVIAEPLGKEQLTDKNAVGYMQKLREGFRNCPVLYANRQLFVIWRSEHSSCDVQDCWARMRAMDKDELKWAASMEFRGYANLFGALHQAQMALTQGKGNASQLLGYKDIWRINLYQNLSLVGEPTGYCHPAVLQFHLDEAWERELFNTLCRYLQNGMHPSETARDLHLHRNTLLHRLERVQEILQLDLSQLDEDEQDFLRISCEIIRWRREKIPDGPDSN